MRDLRRNDAAYIRELGHLVAGLDPLGLIALGSPEDEYECILGPIIAGLRDGLSTEAFTDNLRAHFLEHFEAEPSDTFAAALMAWHRTRI